MTRTVAVELGEFLSPLQLRHLPSGVVEKAQICVLDAVGMALEGYRLEPVRLAIETAVELSAQGGPATVWGTGQRVDALLAAFANCVAIHALLHDDTLMDSWSCHVQIRLRDGRVHTGDERMVDRAVFYPDREGITTKFKMMVAGVISEARAEAIASATFELDRAAGVEPFVDLLTVNDRE